MFCVREISIRHINLIRCYFIFRVFVGCKGTMFFVKEPNIVCCVLSYKSCDLLR